MCGLLSPILSGGSVVIPARFDKNKFWVDFAKEKCSWYTAGESEAAFPPEYLECLLLPTREEK